MPTATDKLPDLSQVSADLQEIVHKRELLAEQLFEKCGVISEGVKLARATIDADLRRGVEVKQFARTLVNFKVYGADVLEVYGVLTEEFAAWKRGDETVASLIKEAEAFVAWLDSLLANLNFPAAPIDEEMLRVQARQCDEANAWVKFDNAMAELGQDKDEG